MKKLAWGIIILLAIIGGILLGRKAAQDKEIELKDNQILVKVKEVGDSRFTADIVEGSELIPYQGEIVFNFETNEEVGKLKEGNEVILEVPKVPIMTNSLPPQMPQTKIIDVIK